VTLRGLISTWRFGFFLIQHSLIILLFLLFVHVLDFLEILTRIIIRSELALNLIYHLDISLIYLHLSLLSLCLPD
jgi:hypothetical protein